MNIWIWLPDYLVSRLYLTTINLEVSFFIWKIVLWPIEYVRMVVVRMVALEILPLYIYIVCIYYILNKLYIIYTLRKKCPYSELFWSAFSRIRTEYGQILRIQSKGGKMRTIITLNTYTSCSEIVGLSFIRKKFNVQVFSANEIIVLDSL